jgi:hypothetical protein
MRRADILHKRTPTAPRPQVRIDLRRCRPTDRRGFPVASIVRPEMMFPARSGKSSESTLPVALMSNNAEAAQPPTNAPAMPIRIVTTTPCFALLPSRYLATKPAIGPQPLPNSPSRTVERNVVNGLWGSGKSSYADAQAGRTARGQVGLPGRHARRLPTSRGDETPPAR